MQWVGSEAQGLVVGHEASCLPATALSIVLEPQTSTLCSAEGAARRELRCWAERPQQWSIGR